MLKDRSNLEEGTHVRLYSQPGKHAFMPDPELFHLVPGLVECANEEAGKGGLLVSEFLRGKVPSTSDIDRKVCEYLRQYAFVPSMQFEREYVPADDHLVTWPHLLREIPARILQELRQIDEVIS